MVEHLIKTTAKSAIRAGLLLAMIAVSPAVFGENLQDPTRPAAFLNSSGRAGNNTGSSSIAISEPVLQSVIISPNRTVAIISGETVKPGDTFGNAQVVKIAEGEVVLRNGGNLQTLKLFSGMEKRLTSDRTKVDRTNGKTDNQGQ